MIAIQGARGALTPPPCSGQGASLARAALGVPTVGQQQKNFRSPINCLFDGEAHN